MFLSCVRFYFHLEALPISYNILLNRIPLVVACWDKFTLASMFVQLAMKKLSLFRCLEMCSLADVRFDGFLEMCATLSSIVLLAWELCTTILTLLYSP